MHPVCSTWLEKGEVTELRSPDMAAGGAAKGPDSARLDSEDTAALRGTGSASVGAGFTEGITLEVLEGPMDGTVLAGSLDAVSIGRRPGNDLSLFADPLVSSEHARLVRTVGDDGTSRWLLEDRGSTNGTWVASGQLSAQQLIAPGDAFVVGNAVVRCLSGVVQETFTPDAATLRSEMQRFRPRLSDATARGWGAAMMLAVQEQSVVISDRHLFLGLVRLNPELPVVARGEGPISRQGLAAVVANAEYWSDGQAWIPQQLSEVTAQTEPLFDTEIEITPRLLRVVHAAERLASAGGGVQIEPYDVLRALMEDPSNRVRELLARSGADMVAVESALASAPRRAPAPRPEPRDAGSAARERPSSAVREALKVPVVDGRTHETAHELRGVIALYHLASADERRGAIKEMLTHEVSKLPPDQRLRLLSQLPELFPVHSAGSAGLEETSRLRDRVAELEAQVRSQRKVAPPPIASIPWPQVLAREGGDLEECQPLDRSPLLFLREVLQFSIAIERFVVSMVCGLTERSISTARIQLPGFKTSLQGHAKHVADGQELMTSELHEYVTSLETWLVAAMAAYYESPEVWFADFWGKINPARVEARFSKKLFSEQKCWSHYKETVRAISPDLVGDEIQAIVRKKAQEQYKRMKERRSTR
jgi:hypothetical protein